MDQSLRMFLFCPASLSRNTAIEMYIEGPTTREDEKIALLKSSLSRCEVAVLNRSLICENYKSALVENNIYIYIYI